MKGLTFVNAKAVQRTTGRDNILLVNGKKGGGRVELPQKVVDYLKLHGKVYISIDDEKVVFSGNDRYGAEYLLKGDNDTIYCKPLVLEIMNALDIDMGESVCKTISGLVYETNEDDDSENNKVVIIYSDYAKRNNIEEV